MAGSTTSPEKRVLVDASAPQVFVEGVLVGNGVYQTNAAIIADCLMQADLRGIDTRGMNRIPSYMARANKACSTRKLHHSQPDHPCLRSSGWQKWLWLFSCLSRHGIRMQDGQRIWHRHGLDQKLEPLWHVGMGGPASCECRNDVSRFQTPLPLSLCGAEKISSWA